MAQISNSDNIIDSRDVIKRIDELKSERDALVEAVNDAKRGEGAAPDADLDALNELLAVAVEALDEWDEDDDLGGEFKRLTALQDEAEGYSSDWTHGATLIRESHFDGDYAQNFAEEIGAFGGNEPPSWIEIDWEKTADNLKVDYTSVEYGNETYLIRS